MIPSHSPVLNWKGAGSEKSAGLALGPGFSVFVVITVSSLQRLYTSLLCREGTACPHKWCSGKGVGPVCSR